MSSIASAASTESCDNYVVLGKTMDRDGQVMWKIRWDYDQTEAIINDFQTDDARGTVAVAIFEAAQHPDPTDLQTIFPDTAKQSPFAACETMSDLASEVWKHEQNSSVFKHFGFEEARTVMMKAFATMDPLLLAEIKAGNVQRRRYMDRDFRLMMCKMYSERLTDDQGKRPAHYLFEFTDECGLPPLKVDAKQLLVYAGQYLVDQNFA